MGARTLQLHCEDATRGVPHVVNEANDSKPMIVKRMGAYAVILFTIIGLVYILKLKIYATGLFFFLAPLVAYTTAP